MPRPLLARKLATRLDAMNGSEQASRVASAASAALDAANLADPADVDLDRSDLARLLAATAAAWKSVNRRSDGISMDERFRWSAVCAIADRIAERWEDESALVPSELTNADGLSGTVLEFLRRSP